MNNVSNAEITTPPPLNNQLASLKLPTDFLPPVHFQCRIFDAGKVELLRRRAFLMGDLRLANYFAHVLFHPGRPSVVERAFDKKSSDKLNQYLTKMRTAEPSEELRKFKAAVFSSFCPCLQHRLERAKN